MAINIYQHLSTSINLFCPTRPRRIKAKEISVSAPMKTTEMTNTSAWRPSWVWTGRRKWWHWIQTQIHSGHVQSNSVQFNFIYIRSVKIWRTQGLAPKQGALVTKNCLLTGRNPEQDQAHTGDLDRLLIDADRLYLRACFHPVSSCYLNILLVTGNTV